MTLLLAGLALWFAGSQLFAQEMPAGYDVSTVKPTSHPDSYDGMRWTDDGVTITNLTLAFIVGSVYNMRDDQVSGLPAWASEQHWDITAKLTDTERGTLQSMTFEQKFALLRPLLEQRFGLRAHTVTSVMATYDLTVAKGGLKLKPVDPATLGKPLHGLCDGCMGGSYGHIQAHDVPLSDLGTSLAYWLKRGVMDHTGVGGKYDLDLVWAPEDGSGTASDRAAPSLQAALEEQMGLKLVATKGPVETLVVDHVDKPADN